MASTNFKVKVAVRVRPTDGEPAFQIAGSEIHVASKPTNATNRFQKRSFAYDAVFPGTISQREVYTDFGKDMVHHALEGYNACVFAYGQTGSGKSHTMIGTATDPGLIPQTCEELFAYMEESKTKAAVTVRISFLEIYNEHIRDLLAPPSTAKTYSATTSSQSLKIRGTEDCYVVGLTEYKVDDIQEVLHLLHQGLRNRATASTKMNDTSSRSHAVISLSIKQQLVSDGGTDVQEKFSVLRLVDLAGSESVASTGATGDRLREGGNINQSLVTLGRVIATLADSARPGARSPVVPYRDSVLTRLLRPSLGGNSRTAMIACVSNAAENVEQTMSTLRYADQAKKITTTARVNQDVITNAEQSARLKQMQQELADLRSQLSSAETTSSQEDKLAEESKLAKLVQFYEDEAAREKLRASILDKQRQEAEERNFALADYLREIGGNGLSSIDLRHLDSFEDIEKAQAELASIVSTERQSIQESVAKWRKIIN